MDSEGPSIRFLASIGNGELFKQSGVVTATLPKYRLADRFVQRQWTPMLRTLVEVQSAVSTPTHAFVYTTP